MVKEKKPSFEDALERLEALVEKLESGDLRLEESLRLFEEGMKLTRHCHERLEEVERRVALLLKEAGAGDSGRRARNRNPEADAS